MKATTASVSRLYCLRGLAIAAACSLGSVQAAPIVYGDYAGSTVDFVGVQEESSTDPGQGLFGAPNVVGDALDFDPQAFAASTSGPAADITDSNLQFMVQAKTNVGITSITFSEAGDTTLAGLSGEAQTTVGTTLFVDILEVNIGGFVTPVSLSSGPLSMTFSPQDSWLLSVDGAGSEGWTGSIFVDLGPILAANSIVGTATKVSVSLDNTLSAASVQGTSAFIQKKDADGLIITIDTFEIPEPSTLAFVLAGLAGIATRRV